jgi:FkbM family methyltransferase
MSVILRLSEALRLIPDGLPGKARLGRMLLRPFMSRKPAVLKDRTGNMYVMPSYAEMIALEIFTFGLYERDLVKAIISFLPKGGTFIDIGANVGALTIPVAKALPCVSIICIEADPKLHLLLQQNVDRNNCKQVQVISCVVGSKDGQSVAFYQAPDDRFGMGSLGPQFNAAPIMLKQRSLDCILEDLHLDRVDVVKMDVEGAELNVLRGARRLLASKRPPVLFFEFCDWAEQRIAGQKPGDAQSFLFGNGYRLFCLEKGGNIGQELLTPLRHGFAELVAVPSHMQIADH